MRCRERGHRACAQDEHALAREIFPAHAAQRLIKSKGDHGGARLIDLGFGMHPLAGAQRGLRQRMDARADGSLLRSKLVGGAHLADDLLLPYHHRVQA